MKKLAILSSLLLLALNSCSNEEIFNEELPNNYEKRITVVAEDLTPAEGTRTSYTDNGNGYSFAWSEGDALGIFPTSGHQTDFPIGADGIGSNTAVFDGGKWALRPNESYAAYYPLIEDFKLNPIAIPVDYTGQTQDGNGSTNHLGKYDFMASTFTEVDAKGNVNFKLQHLGCLVQFKFTMPEADTYSLLEISSNNSPFIISGEYSLSDNEHKLKNVETSGKVTIRLNNASTTDDQKELIIAAMFAPVDLSGKKMVLHVTGSKSSYSFIVEGKDLTQGKSVNQNQTWTIPYVTFHAEAEQTFSMSTAVETLEYSVSGGTWTELGTSTVPFGGENGDLRLRGKNLKGTNYAKFSFGIDNNFVSCSGDIRTLLDYEAYNTVDCQSAKFGSLFVNCTQLISAPDLPAMTLAEHCYDNMFKGCTNLTEAPVLPATVLSDYCYANMFEGCSSLTYVKCLAADVSAYACMSGMLRNVSNTGIFVRHNDVTWEGSKRGWLLDIPDNWVIKEEDATGKETIVDNMHNHHQYVDLGINVNGKRILWATHNVGALDTHLYGDYFAWAETEPYYSIQQDGSYYWKEGKTQGYKDESYKYYKNSYGSVSVTKYNSSDKKTTIEANDDAATYSWGGSWRMPSIEELGLLKSECYWHHVTSYNGNDINGYIIYKAKSEEDKGIVNYSSSEPNYSVGNAHIFLPVGGYFDGTSVPDLRTGYYWSSTRLTIYGDVFASVMDFFASTNSTNHAAYFEYTSRSRGCAIRPVFTLEE